MTNQVAMLVQALDGGAALAMAMLVAAVAAKSRAGLGRDRDAYLGAVVTFLAIGFGYSTAIAAVGGFNVGKYALPLLALSMVIPLVVGPTITLASPGLRRLISQPEVQPSVIVVHALRLIQGSVFVLMLPLGVLPAIFALPAGLGDVLVGLGALAASRWITSGRRGRVVWWNVFGLLDLANATVLGVITVPGSLHVLQTSPSSALLLASPLTIIPTFCVPIYVLLHLISLRFLAVSRSGARLSHVVTIEAAS
jgi:hypothetical protein